MKQFDHISGKIFQAEDAKIYYEIIDNPGKPVMLFLHGGMGNIEDFNSILDLFVDDYHIIGIDSRGHGKSSRGSAALTYQQLQRDVESLLNSLAIRKVSFVGFSDGAIVAYRLAADKILEVEKIISVGGTWSNDDVKATAHLLKGFTIQSWREKMASSYTIYERLSPEKDHEAVLKRIVSMWLDETPSGYPNELVKNIKARTLIIRGDNDHLFPRKSAAQLADLIEKSVFANIPFAGHVVFHEQKEIFSKIVKQFLASD